MDDKIKLLDRFYNTFINLENPKDFFNGLCDYIDYLEGVPEFDRISKELIDKIKPLDEKIEELNRAGVKKMKEVHKELVDYISANKIENTEIKEALNEYNLWLEGKIVGSRELADGLHDKLSDVIRVLHGIPEHKEFVSKYILFWKDKVNIQHWLFPQEMKDYFDFVKEAQEKYKTELWGRMNDVIRYYNIIKNGGEKRKELVRQSVEENSLKASYELFSSHDILYGEWKQIESGKYDKAIFFSVKEIKPVMIRFQNYILKELEGKKNERQNALQALNEMENKKFGIDPIPQRTFAEIQKEVGESHKWQRQQDLEDKRHRETLKQNRILATKESKYVHAIDTILERTALGESFSIDYYYFNFDDRMDASKILEKFLLELKENGCFEDYKRSNYAGGTRFGFIKANTKKIKEFRSRMVKNEELLQTAITPVVSAAMAKAQSSMQALAEQLNKSFGKDKQTLEIIRTWFDALPNATNGLEAYGQIAFNTIREIQPVMRKLEENTRLIREATKSCIMPNFEAIAPIVKEIQKQAKWAEELYRDAQPKKFPVLDYSPNVSAARQRNDILIELGRLNTKLDEFSEAKNNTPVLSQAEPKKEKKSEKVKPATKGKEFIKKIIIIKTEKGKKLVAVNDDYQETKKIRNSEWWEIFVKEAEERNMINRTNVKEIPADMASYFNYNKKCPIYMDGKYALTEIFTGRGIDSTINPDVKTKVMTENKYLSIKNRKKKK